ncbi:unnamed protein product [Gordionus sp. m RMFG-2023]
MPIWLKSKTYKSIVIPVLLYGSETWDGIKVIISYADENDTVELGVYKINHMTNDFLRAKMGIQPMVDLINKNRLRWYGHILRRETNDVNRKYWTWRCRRGRPRVPWKGQVDKVKIIKKNLDMALTQSRWKKLIRTNLTTVGPCTR